MRDKRAVLKVSAYIDAVLNETPFDIKSIDVGVTERGFSVSLFLDVTADELNAVLDGAESVLAVDEPRALPVPETPSAGNDSLDLQLDDGSPFGSIDAAPITVTAPPSVTITTRAASKNSDVAAALKKRLPPKEVLAERTVSAGPSFLTAEDLQKYASMYVDDGGENV